MRVAAIQLAGAGDNRDAIVDRIVSLLARAGQEQVELAALPELALSPYFAARPDADPSDYDNTIGDEMTTRIASAARDAGLWLVLPIAERVGRVLYNSAVLISPRGEFVGAYRKVHLPGGFPVEGERMSLYERSYFAEGDRGFPVFDTGEFRVGMLICYDRFYPEAARSLALQGVDVICIPTNSRYFGSAWARDGWELLIRARAYENGCYLIAPGKAGNEAGQDFIGDSLVVAPTAGRVIARAESDGDEVIVADIEKSELDAMRRRTNWARDWRGDQYFGAMR